MLVWRINGNVIKTVLCCIMYCTCAESYAFMHTHMRNSYGTVGLGSVCFVFAWFFLTSVCQVELDFLCVFFTCCKVGCQYQRSLERLISEMAYYMSSGTLNSAHSLI